MNKTAIFNTMSPENQKIALQAVGISCDGDEYGEDMGIGEENLVPTWDALDVSVGKTTRPPIANSSKLFKDMAEKMGQKQVNMYGMPEAGDEEEMMIATGMV